MERVIDDAAYLSFLSNPLLRKGYEEWRERMLRDIDGIVSDFENMSVEDVMSKRNLSPKDVALLVRLNYLTSDEATKYKLWEIERTAPL